MPEITNMQVEIIAAQAIIEDMINKASAQGAQNYEMLYSVEKGLNELMELIDKKLTFEDNFLQKWNGMMGWAPRVFEGHPLLDLLQKLDTAILSYRKL